MKSAKAMDIKTEANGLNIYSEGLVTETFKASQRTDITGYLDLDTSSVINIDATDDITIDSGDANIELNP